MTSAGWYPDPLARNELRYWDGASWTDHVSTAGDAGIDRLDGSSGPLDEVWAEQVEDAPADAVTIVAAAPAGRSYRGRAAVVGSAVVALLLVGVGLAGGEGGSTDLGSSDPRAMTSTLAEEVESAPSSSTSSSTSTSTSTPSSTTSTSSAPPTTAVAAPAEPAGVAVSSVTDGDTIVVSDGRRVRLAQVDAPERGECFGTESTAALRSLVADRMVTLRRPTNGPEKDRYGRTLAIVSVDGTNVNEALVREGAAEWGDEFAREDSELAASLGRAEREARGAGRGLWSACATPATTAATPPPTSPSPSPSPRCHASYEGTCIPPNVSDADCAGGGGNGPHYVEEKNIRVVGPDDFRLDDDGNGIGCQSP